MSKRKLVAAYASQEAILSAIGSVRERGWAIFDAFTPRPVPGMDEALGLQPPRAPALGFGLGFAGMSAGLALRLSTAPAAGFEALVPLAIQSTLALALLGAVATVLAWRRLSPSLVPVAVEAHLARERYVLVLEDPGSEVEAARRLLEATGAVEVES